MQNITRRLLSSCRLINLCLLSYCCGLVDGLNPQTQKNDCPLWHVPDQNGHCVCGADLKRNLHVFCEKNFLLISYYYRLTWNNLTNEAEILTYPFTTRDIKPKCYLSKTDRIIYHRDMYHIPINMSGEALNSFTCKIFNRQSTYCKQCLDGYAPAPFTDGNSCFNCSEHKYLWILNLFLQIIMTTCLYVLFIPLQINGASSPFNVIFTYSQLVVLGMKLDGTLKSVFVCVVGQRLFDVIMTILSFFNLDFFHSFLPPSCVSTSMNAIDTLFFDYIIAIYPLCLTLFFFLCIKLHDRKNLVIIVLVYPLRCCFKRFRTSWDPKQTILKTFTTFFLLSFSKMFLISINLTLVVQPYNVRGEVIHNSTVLLYDPSIMAFHSKHIPYVILAISTTVFFILLPILILLLYPTRCFRKCITLLGFRRWDILHNIMDVFQGPFKDGTEGTPDYRYFSALHLLLRIGNGLNIFVEYLTNYNRDIIVYLKWLVAALFYIFLGMLLLIIKPYKKVWMSHFDGLIFTSTGVCLILFLSPLPVLIFKILLSLSLLFVIPTVVYTICTCAKKCKNRN